jgi:hypothetical protein
MGCRVEYIIILHPIPLAICFLFNRLYYLARITAVAHRHKNTTRQTGEGSSRHHPWFPRFTTPWHPKIAYELPNQCIQIEEGGEVTLFSKIYGLNQGFQSPICQLVRLDGLGREKIKKILGKNKSKKAREEEGICAS